MTPDDDPLDGMHRFDRDDELFDRLLDGAVDPDDAPDELAEVAALVRQAGGDAAPGELADEDRLVAAMAAVLPGVADVPEPSSSLVGSSTVIHRLLRAKVATVVVVSAVGLGAAAAAVSTGRESSRPEVEAADTTMVQVTVATTAPTTASSTTSTTTSTTTTTTTTTTSTTAAPPTSAAPPVTVDPAIVALCQAWKAGHQTKPPTPPSAELIAAAKAAGKSVDDFCERALGEKERHDRDEADRRERDRRDQEEKDKERRKKEDEDRRRREGDHGDQGGRGDGGGEGHDRG